MDEWKSSYAVYIHVVRRARGRAWRFGNGLSENDEISLSTDHNPICERNNQSLCIHKVSYHDEIMCT